MDSMDDIIKEFIKKSQVNLDGWNRDPVALEKDLTSQEFLAETFRSNLGYCRRVRAVPGRPGSALPVQNPSSPDGGEN